MNITRLVASAVAAVLACSCGAGWEAQVRSSAAAELGCPAESIRVVDATVYAAQSMTSAYSAVGCGRQAVFVWDGDVDRYLDIEPEFLQRASFEMSCPANQLVVVWLDSWTTRGVDGCGRRIVYTFIPYTNQWTSSAGGEPIPPPPPPPVYIR